MKSKSILTTGIILCSVVLSACGRGIPNTGGEIAPTNNSEKPGVTLTPTYTETATETTVAARSTATPEAPGCLTPTASVKNSSVYLREGPDIRYQGTARYQNGDKFTLLGSHRDWFQAEATDGNQGWLYKDWLTLPPNLDLDDVCSASLADLPPKPGAEQANPSNPEDPEASTNPPDDGVTPPDPCEPTYYNPCD